MPSLLFIFAHPDDESFGAAGTASRYADEGVRLTLAFRDARRAASCGGPRDDIFAGL